MVAAIATIEELSSRSIGMASAFIQCSCYAGLNILESGSMEQKNELLPRVANGELLFSYGISEPDVGGDVASVLTIAKLDNDEVIINGSKRWCSGVLIANYIFTLVRSGPADERYRNLSIVLVPPDIKGISIIPQNTMGLKGTGGTCDVYFDDVRVPQSNILGGLEGWNNGWSKIISTGLDVEKIEVSALALGIARAAIDDAWQYSQERIQFGKPICHNQSIRHMLSDSKTKLEACRLMTYQGAWLANQNTESSIQMSMAKLFVTETARDIVLTCQEVLGAYGYVKDFDMERYVRDILVMPIIGGSSAMQKNNIANRLNLPK
jgi:alkylation response protein AidB-like acyl-CoA dehydrogenase